MWAPRVTRVRARVLQHDLQHDLCAKVAVRHPPRHVLPARHRQPARSTRLRHLIVRAAEDCDQATDDAPVVVESDVQCVSNGTEVACVVDDDGGDGKGPLTSESRVTDVLDSDDVIPTQQAFLGSGATAALLVLPFFFWGSSMAAMKLILDDVSPLLVAAARLIPSGALLVAYAASRQRPLPQSWAGWASVALFALVDGTLFQGSLAEGLTRTSAGLGSVIIDSQPLTVAVLAAAFFGESISSLGALGLVLGLSGLVVMELPPLQDGGIAASLQSAASLLSRDGPGSWLDVGETWMFIAAQAMAIGTVWVRVIVRQGTDPVMATGLHMVLGGIPLLVLSVTREPDVLLRLLHGGLPLQDIALLTYVSFFGGCIAYGLYFNAATRGSLLQLSSLTFLTPLFAAVCGYAALGETLTQQQLVGAGIVLAGVTLVNTRKKA